MAHFKPDNPELAKMMAFALEAYKKPFPLLARALSHPRPDRNRSRSEQFELVRQSVAMGALNPPGDSRFKVVIRIAADGAAGRPDV